MRASSQGDTIFTLDGKFVDDATVAARIVQRGEGAARSTSRSSRGQRVVDLGTIKPRKIAEGYLLGIEWRVPLPQGQPARAVARSTQQDLGGHARRSSPASPKLVHPEQRKQVSSVVGIVHVSGEALRADYRDYLGIVALISISLGILNLLPFLPLDGGHILVALVERVRRPRAAPRPRGALLARRFRARRAPDVHRR